MTKGLLLLALALSPVILFGQTITDSGTVPQANPESLPVNKNAYADSAFLFMFNASTTFYEVKDQRINKFLAKYGYTPPQNIPVGLRLELAVMPSGKKMVYSINASTIISHQDILTADLSLGIYRRFFETKSLWISAGLALGEHFDRIDLNGSLPPLLDSLAKEYTVNLSLHRTGLIVEPGTKIYWFPVQSKKLQFGLTAGIYYDFDFNSKWRVGYYPQNHNSFKNLRKPTHISTIQEFGWVFSTGLTVVF